MFQTGQFVNLLINLSTYQLYIMPRLLLIALTALLFVSCREKRTHEHKEWGDIFKQHGVENGCFIIRDHTHEIINYYNRERCLRRFSPASTFKIFNSLVALEEGVAQDETFTLPWDSVVRSVPEWNKSMSMLEAFKVSNVPFYQELARRIGKPVMQRYLDTVQYGNMEIGGAIDKFWLDNSLQISADEQVGFLRKLYFNELPFTERTQRIVRFMMEQEETPAHKIYYKTGWAANGDTAVAGGGNVLWVTGFTERIVHIKEHEKSMNKAGFRMYPYFFALNFTIPAVESSSPEGKKYIETRKALLMDLLKAAGAL